LSGRIAPCSLMLCAKLRRLMLFDVSSPADFAPAFQAAAKSQCSGVLMLSAPLFGGNPQLLADLALQNRLPAINIFPDFPQRGVSWVMDPNLRACSCSPVS
jgi:hypothetical protein